MEIVAKTLLHKIWTHMHKKSQWSFSLEIFGNHAILNLMMIQDLINTIFMVIVLEVFNHIYTAGNYTL